MNAPSPPRASTVVQFPVPSSVSAIASTCPPVLSAFPTGRPIGGIVDIVIPVVLTVGWDAEIPISDAIREATSWVRKGQVMIEETFGDRVFCSSVDCRPLAESDLLHVVPAPGIRVRLLRRASIALAAAAEEMKADGDHPFSEIENIADQLLGVFRLLEASGADTEPWSE